MEYTFEEIMGFIRKRPMMYLGYLGQRGYHHFFDYFFENLSARRTQFHSVEVILNPDDWTEIAVSELPDYLSKDIRGIHDFVSLHSQLDLFILLALSEEVSLEWTNGETFHQILGRKGVCEYSKKQAKNTKHQLWIRFKFDTEIFGDFELNFDAIQQVFRRNAILNPRLLIKAEDRRTDRHSLQYFQFPKGLAHELDLLTLKGDHGAPIFKLAWSSELEGDSFQFALAYMDVWLAPDFQMTYSGNIELSLGGSLLEGTLAGLKHALQTYANAVGLDCRITKKIVKTQLILLAGVRTDKAEFGGCTRTRLQMPKLQSCVKNHISGRFLSFLKDDPKVATAIFFQLGLIGTNDSLGAEKPPHRAR